MRCFVISLFAFLIGTCCPAFACGSNTPEELAQRQKDAFRHYDTDQSGLVSLEEYARNAPKIEINILYERYFSGKTEEPDVKKVFGLMDKDHSGFLTFEEWAEFNPPKRFMWKCGR